MAAPATAGRHRLRPWLLNGLMLLLSVGVTVIAAEGLLRLTGTGTLPGDQRSPYPRYYFARNDTTGYDLAENFPASDFALRDYKKAHGGYFQIWTNALGCYDHPARNDSGAVLLVGDSFSWGYVPFEQTWASGMERETATPVVRCGVGGYGPKQARLKSAKIIRRLGPPALVILGYFVGNDLMDDYLYPQATVNDGYLANRVTLTSEATGERKVLTDAEIEANKRAALEPPHGLGILKKFIADHSVIYNLLRENAGLRQLFASMGLADPPPRSGVPLIFRPDSAGSWLEGAWQEQLDSLRAFAREVRQEGSQLVVVIIPTREQVFPGRRPAGPADWDGPSRRVREFLAAEQVPALDLLGEFREVLPRVTKDSTDAGVLYWPTDIHLGLGGNQLTGLLVSRFLLSRSLVHPADRDARLARVEAAIAQWTPPR